MGGGLRHFCRLRYGRRPIRTSPKWRLRSNRWCVTRWSRCSIPGQQDLGSIWGHIRGLAGVHDQLIADTNTRLREALASWVANFARTIAREKDIIVHERKTKEVNASISLAIYNWLSTIVNTFNLALDAIAETPLDYRCRATLILFSCDDAGDWSGGHWISFAGRLPAGIAAGRPRGTPRASRSRARLASGC